MELTVRVTDLVQSQMQNAAECNSYYGARSKAHDTHKIRSMDDEKKLNACQITKCAHIIAQIVIGGATFEQEQATKMRNLEIS